SPDRSHRDHTQQVAGPAEDQRRFSRALAQLRKIYRTAAAAADPWGAALTPAGSCGEGDAHGTECDRNADEDAAPRETLPKDKVSNQGGKHDTGLAQC